MSEVINANAASEESKMPHYLHAIKWSAIGTALSVGILGGCGSIIDYDENQRDKAAAEQTLSAISRAENQLEEYEDDTKTYETRNSQLEELYGYRCLAAVLPYSTDELLKKSTTDQVVDDLLRHTDLPCGSVPSEVRKAVMDVDTTKSQLERLAAADYDAMVNNLLSLKEVHNKKVKDSFKYEGVLMMGAMGLAVSCWISFLNIHDLREKLKKVSRR